NSASIKQISGGWLESTPQSGIHLLTAAITIVFIVGSGIYLSRSNGIVDPTGHAIGRDFINLWTAARLVLQGQTPTIFDIEAFHAVEQAVVGPQLPQHLWSYPPHFLLPVLPLGFFNYAAALTIWSLIPAAIYALAAGWPRSRNVLLFALAPATLV